MNDPRTIACFSVFNGNFFGHGGEKRTMEIAALVSEQFTYQHILCPYRYNKLDAVSFTSLQQSRYIPQVLSVKSNRKNFTLKSVLKESTRFSRQEKFLQQNEALFHHADAVVWENTFPDFFRMASLLKQRYSKKIIACPHNLESLIPLQKLNWFGRNKMEYLEQELEALQLCDKVFTISEEEEWLLNLFGISATYLPYYPLGELFQSLLQIRQYRSEHEKGDFYLVLGSASNPPTRTGMMTWLSIINKITSQQKIRARFKVTGYGTEQLVKDFNAGNIDVLGYTENNVLNDLMRNCKAMIISQDYSTGALTKIPEMLIAGIPVIVNNGGARTFKRTEGVYVYNSEADFADLMSTELSMPHLLPKPEKQFDSFLLACRDVVQHGGS